MQNVIRGHERENALLKVELQVIQENIETLQEIKVRLQQQECRNKEVAEELKAH